MVFLRTIVGITVISVVTLCGATAKAQSVPAMVDVTGQCTIEPGSKLALDDYKDIFDKLASGQDTSVKSRYETQAQYEQRIRTTGKRSYAIAGKPFTNNEIDYDAEREVFVIADDRLRRLTSYLHKLSYSVYVDVEHEVIGKVRMRNGWGDEWTEDVLEGYSIRILQGDALESGRSSGVPRKTRLTFFRMDTGPNYHEERILVPMPRDIARANDGKIRAAFIITPFQDSNGKYTDYTPTAETKYYTINANVHCAAFLDKDGRVIKVVPTLTSLGVRSKKRRRGLLGGIF